MNRRKMILALAITLLALPGVSQAKDWGKYVRHTPTLGGLSGLMHVISADSGKAGLFSISLLGEAFSASNFLVTNDTNSRINGTIAISVTPVKFLEAFIKLQTSSNSNDKGDPPLIQIQGDFALGAKGFHRVLPSLSLGGDFHVQFRTGVGKSSFDWGSTSVMLRALATFDLFRIVPKVPLRFHFNFGYYFDNSDNMASSNLTHVQRYALRINESGRMLIKLGIEAPLPYVTPFIEWGLEIPVGLPSDPTAAGASSWPHLLTIGAKVNPWRGLGVHVAVDIGLTNAARIGVPAVPPYTILFGLSYSFGGGAGQVRTITKVVTKEVVKTQKVVVKTKATTGRIIGRAINIKTAMPVKGAKIDFPGKKLTALLTGEDGSFTTYPLAAGTLKVRASKRGYKAKEVELKVAAGKDVEETFAMTPENRRKKIKRRRRIRKKVVVRAKSLCAKGNGMVMGKVVDAKDKPVIVLLQIAGCGRKLTLVSAPGTGHFIGKVPAGPMTITIKSESYKAAPKVVVVKPKGMRKVTIRVRKK